MLDQDFAVPTRPRSAQRSKDQEEECPNSPKVLRNRRRGASSSVAEKRARSHSLADGERIFAPASRSQALLLLRPNGSFAYVHDADARFSEGVQGKWHEADGELLVELEPMSFGYCYADSFRVDEIVGVCHTVTLRLYDQDVNGRYLCILPEHLQTRFSWLDPSQEEEPTQVAVGSLSMVLADMDPCSPKIPGKTRKNAEKRAMAYKPAKGERLYRLASNPDGVLLLRPDSTFAYVHSDKAHFSEGVQGNCTEEPGNIVRLHPTRFGYCYWDSFDDWEIIGVSHAVILTDVQHPSSIEMLVCHLPADLENQFSWLDPNREEIGNGTSGSHVPVEPEIQECPNSPKVPSRKKRNAEKRARLYISTDGEQLFIPESCPNGLLLLRPDGSFAYVYDSDARFSEGVQGNWKEHADSQVGLTPSGFGWSYAESFDAHEIVGVSHVVTLIRDQILANGKLPCQLPEKLANAFSWLDPSRAEVKSSPVLDQKSPSSRGPVNLDSVSRSVPKLAPAPRRSGKLASLTVQTGAGANTSTSPRGSMPGSPSSQEGGNLTDCAALSESDCPNSPKVRSRKSRAQEKRAVSYEVTDGECLYSPESRPKALLLLRPGGAFSYVHDSDAKFSEGVQGQWREKGEDQVELHPFSFGYCYADSFAVDEIVDVCHTVVLCPGKRDQDGRQVCVFPGHLQTHFSWLDPSKEEAQPHEIHTTASVAGSLNTVLADMEPCSPKIPGKTRKDAEKRAVKYEPVEGEQLYSLASNPDGVLLLRPDNTFAYVHSEKAHFSEGVQGHCMEQPGNTMQLCPTRFGYCYWDSFDDWEIIGVSHIVTLTDSPHSSGKRLLCHLSAELENKFSWLEPNREEQASESASGSPPSSQLEVEECPNSPKVPSRKKRNPEKRAKAYAVTDGERLFGLESCPDGRLLLRPNGTFSYVYNVEARFSEGVQGNWTQEADDQVSLSPTSFGYIYEESFDAQEILGVSYSVHLPCPGTDPALCRLPEEAASRFSWLDPTREEAQK
eukprot:TRINITY_DN57254_c0_g1_i1.p1 TRINITY_DN57254_c0_g1~~TRINITY_DN57254_c0_g1_i1.p1  ORF type:complete len:1008 (-),score=144.50 TRINITY_DN57254_c0_g1_i1:12-3035(-)